VQTDHPAYRRQQDQKAMHGDEAELAAVQSVL
jgi:hypothetical protein